MTTWLSKYQFIKVSPYCSSYLTVSTPDLPFTTHTHKHTLTCVHTCTQAGTLVHMGTLTHVYICTHTVPRAHTCTHIHTHMVEGWVGRTAQFLLREGCLWLSSAHLQQYVPLQNAPLLACLAPAHIQYTWGTGCALWSLQFSTGCIFPCKLIRHYLHPLQLRRERFWTLAFYSRLCFSFTFAY